MKRTEVFVDATAWIALADTGEARHAEAVRIYRDLLHQSTRLVTSELMLAEAHVLIRRRIGYQAAKTFLERCNESPRIEIVYVDPALEAEAKRILEQYHDHDFSLADAVSFAIMRERELSQAFTFDQHFIIAGFLPCT